MSEDQDLSDEIKAIMAERAKVQAEIEAISAERDALVAEAAAVATKAADKAAAKLFAEFDANGDGFVDLEELAQGVRRQTGTVLSKEDVEKLMTEFAGPEASLLKRTDFPTEEALLASVNALLQEARRERLREAREQREAEEDPMARFREQEEERDQEPYNDADPTLQDRALSTLPYLFPLVDCIPAGESLLDGTALGGILAGVYSLYEAFPFGLAPLFFYISLQALGDRRSLNRLVRFNLKQATGLQIQAILVRIATSVTAGALEAFDSGYQDPLKEPILSVLFVYTVWACAYSVASSLAGVRPMLVPFVSEEADKRSTKQSDADASDEDR